MRIPAVSVCVCVGALACGVAPPESPAAPLIEQSAPWPETLLGHPEDGYHFDGVADPYFEGWYHKVAVSESGEAFFFIYTVLNPAPKSAYPAHAFLYCGRSATLQTVYQEFPAEAFSAEANMRDARIGPGARTTALRFAGAAEEDGHRCSWDIHLDDGVAWPETMGWATGAEDLETNWTVGTITAGASGWVEFDGERIEFDRGIGYCDHNWGSIFPQEWIWMQANAFADAGAALSLSGGTVPVGAVTTNAYLIGLLLDGEITAFRSQDLDVISASAAKGSWSVVGERLRERITIEASCALPSMFHLLVPTEEGMLPRAWESLEGTVAVTLETRGSVLEPWTPVFDDVSSLAGVEIGD